MRFAWFQSTNHPKYSLGRLLVQAVLILSAAAATTGTAYAQTDRPDSVASEDEPPALETSFRVYPTPLWTRSTGFAAGIRYAVRNIVLPHDRVLVIAKPGQHLGRYSATYFAGDPNRHALYGLVSGYYEDGGRRWYFGIGPSSSVNNRMAVEKTRLDVEVRLGLQPFDRRAFVQPVWSYQRHDVRDYASWNQGAFVRLDGPSQERLTAAVTGAPLETNVYGLDAGIDLREGPGRRHRGALLQASARRHTFPQSGRDAFDRYEVGAHLWIAFDQQRLSLRALTRLSDAPLTVPFYLLPILDDRLLPGYAWYRFVGNDLVAFTLEYAVPIFQFFEYAAMDAVLSAGAASVYDDISEQFESSISFEKTVTADRTAYPLRPSAAIGFELESFTEDGWSTRVLLGWSPEGIRLVRFGFVHDLQSVQRNRR